VRAGHRPGASQHCQSHGVLSPTTGISLLISAALSAPTSGPRKRWARVLKAVGSPVLRKRCLAGAARSRRYRSPDTRAAYTSFAVSSALETRVTASPTDRKRVV